MEDFNAPELHDVKVCGCDDCDIIRWEYAQEKGQ